MIWLPLVDVITLQKEVGVEVQYKPFNSLTTYGGDKLNRVKILTRVGVVVKVMSKSDENDE